MASPLFKGVCSLTTPLKSPKLYVRSSPINSKIVARKVLSATSIKPVSEISHFGSSAGHCKPLTNNKPHLFSSEERSPLQKRAARCLFPSERTSKFLPPEKLSSSAQKEICCWDCKLPSFDTPLRKSISRQEYKVNESFILGRGSYGLVVEGRYQNNHVAVKLIPHYQENMEMWKSEINALKLKHPNIIEVFKVISDPIEDLGFVFMELYSYTNLEYILQCQSVSYQDKLRYLKQIGSAVEFCHRNGVLHLDIKPKNLIVKTKEKTCKLCDFGSSVHISDISRMDKRTKGTLKYTAPELLKGEIPSEKSDVYSFGITMWQTIYQEVPYYDDEELEQIVYKVVKHNYRPASKAGYDSRVHHIYEACWQANPLQRPSMSTVLLMIGE